MLSSVSSMNTKLDEIIITPPPKKKTYIILEYKYYKNTNKNNYTKGQKSFKSIKKFIFKMFKRLQVALIRLKCF